MSCPLQFKMDMTAESTPTQATSAYSEAPNFSGISSKSSEEVISITLFTSAVLRNSSFAPAYSIRSSLLHVTGR